MTDLSELWHAIEICGQNTSGFADGAYDRAQFYNPSGLCLCTSHDDGGSDTTTSEGRGRNHVQKTRSRTLLCLDYDNNRVRRIALSDGSVSTLAGSGVAGFENGDALNGAVFTRMSSICVDPINPGCFFIGDASSVRYCDGKTISLLVAGCAETGYVDGVGSAAQFSDVGGLLCGSDGQTLYVSDTDNLRLRTVDLKSRIVKTVCGDGEYSDRDGYGVDASIKSPYGMCFDRSSLNAPESVLFVATAGGLRRFDTTTTELITPGLLDEPEPTPEFICSDRNRSRLVPIRFGPRSDLSHRHLRLSLRYVGVLGLSGGLFLTVERVVCSLNVNT